MKKITDATATDVATVEEKTVPEEADAGELLMGQHGKQQPEDETGGHRIEDEEQRHPQAVQEVVRRQDLLNLREADVALRLYPGRAA